MEAVVSIQWVHSGVHALLNGQVKDVKQMWMSVWAASLHVSMGAPVSTSRGATPVSAPLVGPEGTVK